PLPIVDWDEGKGPGALCFLPVCGIICALPIIAVLWVCRYYMVDSLVAGAMALLASFVVCGFVHFDGYMDTADSLLSARDRETKLRILKDSTVGAFSVIAIVALLIVDFAAFTAIYDTQGFNFLALLFVPAMSRSVGDIILFFFEPLSSSGIMKYFKTGQKKIHNIIAILTLISLISAMSIICSSVSVAVVGVVCVFVGLMIAMHAQKELGGINGDIVGAVIVITEALCYLLLPAVL
ncbi:MAG: adenosylcobinamide-GDP ribazoletransferase, partial [Anaerofustis stercorihominis]|nr:adenosylcobinamide-GDP ribazoletransferase [Anaerofustis stercorihominis]